MTPFRRGELIRGIGIMCVIAVLCAYLATMIGCATTGPVQKLLLWTDCEGHQHAADIQVYHGPTPFACPALAFRHKAWMALTEELIAFPALACTTFWNPWPDEPRFWRAVMILPPAPLDDLVRAHEEAHIEGAWHPPGLPLVQFGGCHA